MPLNKLHDVFTLDTSCFYFENEIFIDKKLNKTRHILHKIKTKYNKYDTSKLKKRKTNTEDRCIICSKCKEEFIVSGNEIDYFNKKEIKFPTRCHQCNEELYKRHTKILNSIANSFKDQLKEKMELNANEIRTVIPDRLIDKNVVSIFDSNLTRSLNMLSDKLNSELVIVKVYYFQVAESIIKNGFFMNGEKYVFFSASAGQIRLKKFVAVKESSLNQCWNTLTCGLNLNKINSLGGVNRNKYLAYLALCNSATDVIDFDIDKSIVVEDFETLVNGQVDYIDNKTFDITRQFMDVPIIHSDGCGIINYGDKNFMCRAPWIKGLLSPIRFHDFIREYCPDGDCVVKDIYGKEYKIIEDDIQTVFTKSQFKMAKYFNNWQEYKDNYKKYKCTFGICNEEDTFMDTKLNYQMLQTLTDITDEEIQYICKPTRNKIRRLSSDIQTMLKVFGVDKYNSNRNSFQQCLEIYPELLQDIYTKETLRAIKNKLEKEAWAGKLDVYGKYTFIIPDLYAFCEYLFLNNSNPDGILKDGEIYCKLFRNSEKVDCLRSPHLDRSHGIRKNIIKSNDERLKWFITNGVYTSCHDLISKLLQFDVDGDRSLVVGDKKFVEIAERNMKYTVPLYYEMGKAEPQILNNKVLYDGMILAYTNGNIGLPSNNISKVWNSDDVDEDIIKILSSLTNFSIDFAKTLFKPEAPKEIQERIKQYTNRKLPHFFIYAKDKDEDNVELINNSTVNKIRKYTPKHNLKFDTSSLGKFNYKILMSNKSVKQDELYNTVIKKYRELSRNVNMFTNIEDNERDNYNFIFRKVICELESICPDKYLLVDILIDNLFNVRKSKFKTVFWNCFGDVVFENLTRNMVEDYIYCTKCGKRFFKEHYNETLCNDCKGYIAIDKKYVICIDCGIEFEVKSLNSKSQRCNNCHKKYRRDYQKELMRNRKI